MEWYVVIGIGVLGLIAFFFSLFIPLGMAQIIRRKKGDKWADHPLTIFGLLTFMYLIGQGISALF